MQAIQCGLAAAWPTNISMASGCSTTQTTASLVVTWVTCINSAPSWIRTTDFMTHRPWASTWPQVTTRAASRPHGRQVAQPRDITKYSMSNTDCLSPHESLALSWPGIAAWTTNTSTASSGIMHHGDPSRRFSPVSETFLISDLHSCPESG